MKRHRIPRKKSRKLFSKGARGTNKRNTNSRPMRGGNRL